MSNQQTLNGIGKYRSIRKALFAFIISLVFIAFSHQEAFADHNAGGELTWKCKANGKFVFTLKLYRYCEGINLGSSALVQSNGPVSSFSLTRVLTQDISPKCYDSTQWMNCYGTNSGFTIEENIYVSGDITLTGVPPSTGWDFYWSSCCRPAPAIYFWGALVDNLEPQNQSYRIKATMFPYNGQNTNPCYDNSPTFASTPTTIICTGYPFTYNHNAVDEDLDSLTFTWTAPLNSQGNSVSYATHTNTSQTTPRGSGGGFIVPAPGFSASVPLPWAHSNMSLNNVPATMDLFTGEINFTSFTKGQYATAVLVTSYRCGIKISEIMRDIPVTLLSCPPTPTIPPLSNNPPQVTFKWFPNSPTPLPLPAGDTVWAGDSVSFYITSTDIQFLPGFVGQTNYLVPRGSQFGAGFADTANGCLYPPCATMDTSSQFFNSAEQWWEGQFGVAAQFSWKTSCNHLNYVDSCFTRSNKYNFVFKILDNWCPAPGSNFQTFTVTVLAPPALPPPKLKCSQVLANGDVRLTWDQPITKQGDSLSSFRKYIIYRSDSGATGPFDTLHVLLDIDSLEYLDTTANLAFSPKYYFIQGISSCNDQGVATWSDTISSLVLTSQPYNLGSSVALDWNEFNPGNNFGTKTTGQYYIWQILNTDTTLIDSTTNTWDSLDVTLCYPSVVEYFVTVEDTSMTFGCSSYSNTVIDTVGDVVPPPPIILDSVSYDTSNNVILGWQASSPDIAQYIIYRNSAFVDTISGALNTYSYTPSSTDSCIMQFSVSAVDTCGNVSSSGVVQTSMCAEIADVIRCDTNKHILIEWNLYNPTWLNGSAWQGIWRSVNGGPFTFLDSVGPVTMQYMDTTILGNTTYAYRIRSWENGKFRGSWTSTTSYTVGSIITGTIVPEPDLRCISWVDDTTLVLQWRKPANPDRNLNRYLIYHSNSSNPSTFAVWDSINGTFTSDNQAWGSVDTNIVVDPDTTHFFYMVSSSGCDGLQFSNNSRVVTPITLDITALSDSVNYLSWNPISNVNTGSFYQVIKESVTFTATPYGTENTQDKLITCLDSAEYWIEFQDAVAACSSVSKKVWAYYEDDTPPAKIFIDSVSMLPDSSFTAVVGWRPNASKDIINYIVTQCSPGNSTVLDTLGVNNNFYMDVNGAPLLTVTEYSVSGVDSCGNSGLDNGDLDCHNTIFVNAEIDRCNKTMKLSWNAYDDFASGDIVEYKVFGSVDGGAFTQMGKTNETNITLENLIQDSYYCFYVQAWESDGVGPFSSSSALECIRYVSIKSPEFAYLEYVTVHDSNTTRLCLKIDTESDLGEYWVKRSNYSDKNFKVISTIKVPDPITPADSIFCHEDHPIDAYDNSYFYYIEVADPCGTVSATTNKARTILLRVDANRETHENVLNWNSYTEWHGGVEKYLVYRRIGNGQLELIKTLFTSSMASLPEVSIVNDVIYYSDDVSREYDKGDGEFCYEIKAVEGKPTFHNDEPAVSASNVVCAVQMPLFYAPNAFTPNGDGLNDVFLPAIAFHDLKSFKMDVYNRWGERIYETESIKNAGWDGTINGKDAPQGAYVYIVRFTSSDGQEYEEQGTVTLTR